MRDSLNQLTDSGKLAMGDVLLLDAEMALLFVRRAANTSNSALQERRLKAAAKAYDRIIAFVPRVSLTEVQMTVLAQKLSALRSSLKPSKPQNAA